MSFHDNLSSEVLKICEVIYHKYWFQVIQVVSTTVYYGNW